MTTTPPSTDRLVGAFSQAVFRQLSRPTVGPEIGSRLGPFRELHPPGSAASLGDAFDRAYHLLWRQYRSEYVYKNFLISKLIFGRHSPRTAAALTEVGMGQSCADLVLVNGTISTYEIKTDLDDFGRLERQLADYASRSAEVNVVVSESRAVAAERAVPHWVGILALRERGTLGIVRPPTRDLGRVNVDHLFLLLRTQEASTVLKRTLGFELDVPPGLAWKRMRQLFAELPVDVALREVPRVLRQRRTVASQLAASETFPASCRALVYGGDLSNVAGQRLQRRLAAPLDGSAVRL